jgi:hypothetical protein
MQGAHFKVFNLKYSCIKSGLKIYAMSPFDSECTLHGVAKLDKNKL